MKGPESLTNAELLAIFLRIGVRGKSAIDLAQELLSRFGSQLAAKRIAIRDLADCFSHARLEILGAHFLG